MYTGNVIGVIMVLAFVPVFAAILRVPFAILMPLIVCVCAIGAYSVHGSMIDIWYMLIFGVVGYVFKKLDYPLAPLVLALVLGDLAENALRQSLIMSQGSLADLLHPSDRRRDHRGGAVLLRAAPDHAALADRDGAGRPPAATGGDTPLAGTGADAGGRAARRRSAMGLDFLLSVGKIVLLDLILAGDNAVVIALAVRTLPPRQQFQGRIWGTVGAVGLRLLFITIVSYLLGVPLLQVTGALLLLWIALKLVKQTGEGGGEGHVRQGTSLLEAIWIILVADVVMSLDNVIAIAGAAHGDMRLVDLRHRPVDPDRRVGERSPRPADEPAPLDHPARGGGAGRGRGQDDRRGPLGGDEPRPCPSAGRVGPPARPLRCHHRVRPDCHAAVGGDRRRAATH